MNMRAMNVCVAGLLCLAGCSSGGGGGGGGAGNADSGAGSGGGGTGGSSSGGTGGIAGSSGSGGAGVGGTGGLAGSGGAAGAAGAPVDAAEAAYGYECHDEADPCSDSAYSCVGFSLGAPGYDGYACSNTCPNGLSDCAESSASSPYNVGCLPFTSADRCMFVCKYNGQTWPCPDGMGCIEIGGSGLGYCLWT